MDNTLQLKIITALQDRLSAPLKKIQAVSGKSAKSLKELRDKLKGLDAAQKDIQSFRSLTNGLKTTQTAMQGAQQRANALAKQLRNTENPTKQLRAEFNRAVAEARKLSGQAKSQAVELQNLRSKLSSAGISTRSLGTHERELRADVLRTNTALDQQTKQLRRASDQQAKLGKIRERFQRTQQLTGSMAITGAAGVATGAGILKPVKAVVDAFAPAEDSYTQLKVAMLDASGNVSPQFEAVKKLAIELGDQLPGTTSDFLDLMTMLRRQGVSAETILGGVGKAAAYLGVQLKLPAEEAAEFSAKMQDALQAAESDMLGIADGMQRMFYAGVDKNNILEGFAKFGPALHVLGKRGKEAFDQIAPLLAMADQSGMRGDAAGNAFRKVFQRTLDEDRMVDANDLLKFYKTKIKLDFTDGKGNFGGLDKMFEQIAKLKKLNSVQFNAVMKTMIGDDAETQQTFTLMMTKGKKGYEEMAAKMAAQADLNKRVAIQLDTLNNVAEAASGSFTNVMVGIGETVSEDLKDLIKWFGDITVSIGKFVKENPALVSTIVKVVAALGILISAFGFFTIALAAFLGPLAIVRYGLGLFAIKAGGGVGAFSRLGGVLKWMVGVLAWLAKALAMTPIGRAISLIATAAFLIWQNWDWLKTKFGEIWANISSTFSTSWEAIKAKGAAVWAQLKTGVTGFWTSTTTLFSSGFHLLSNAITTWNAVQTFQTVYASISAFFSSKIADFADFGRNMVQGLVDGIKGMAGQAKEAIEGVGSGVVGWFKDKLGIRSPSRVFMQLGGFVSEGAALGIQQHQSVAMKAAAALAASVIAAGSMNPGNANAAGVAGAKPLRIDQRAPLMNSARGGVMSSASAPGAIEIHIHAGAQSPLEIARAVRLELERLESAKASKNRSKFVDYGE